MKPLQIFGLAAFLASFNPVVCADTQISPAYSISDMGIVNEAGSSARAINDAGIVVGALRTASTPGPGTDPEHAPAESPPYYYSFYWNKQKLTKHDDRFIEIAAVNNKGQMLVNKCPADYSGFGPQPPFGWRASLSEGDEWNDALPASAVWGTATAINDNGQIIGELQFKSKNATDSNVTCPAVWNGDEVHCLEVPPSYTTAMPGAINNQGQIVGSLEIADKGGSPFTHKSAALWDISGVTLLGKDQGFSQSGAIAINKHGNILCFEVIDHNSTAESIRQNRALQAGFLWVKGKRTTLITSDSLPDGINPNRSYWPTSLNDADVVVGSATNNVESHVAFIWQNQKMTDLNSFLPPASGWILRNARGINNRGQIVGEGLYKGHSHAFLLTPQK